MLITEVTQQPQLDLSTIIKGAKLGARMLKQLPVQEGLGKTLSTAALAGSLALANPAQAADAGATLGNKLATCAGDFAAMVVVLGKTGDNVRDGVNYGKLYDNLARKALETSQQLIDRQQALDLAKTRMVNITRRVDAGDARVIGDVADSLESCAATLEQGQSVSRL